MANKGKYSIGIRLMLLRDYIQQNASKERVVERRELESYLAKKGCPVEKKTIYADLAILGTVFGLQLDYDPHKKGYRLLNPPFEPYEVQLLVDCVNAAPFITEQEASELVSKIRPLENESEQSKLNRPVLLKDGIHREVDSIARKADIIHQAMSENKKISFRYIYYIPDHSNHVKYSDNYFTVSPKKLVWDNGYYRLERYRNDRYILPWFDVERMSHIRIEPEWRNFKEDPKYEKIKQNTEKMFEMMYGVEKNITIRFRKDYVKSVLCAFGEDTILVPIDNRYFKITVREKCNIDFYGALAQFGCVAKILAPPEAVKGFMEFVEDFEFLYKKDIEPLYLLDADELNAMI